jgi:glutathione S-transferase
LVSWNAVLAVEDRQYCCSSSEQQCGCYRQDSEGQQQAAQALSTELHWLEAHFDSMGPYFMGTEFSLVDISLLPFFLRFGVLQHYRGFSLPSVRSWHADMGLK